MSLPLKFVNHRIDEYALQVTYHPREGQGDIIYNLCLIRKEDREYAIGVFKHAFEAGLSVSNRVKFADQGETIAGYTIPDGYCGIYTICSITLDALLMKRGVPLNPIGGGVVEIDGNIPKRFTTIIQYEYTTIDPLQALISQEITSVVEVMTRGSGTILANIRECHREAESLVGDVLDELTMVGFTGILDVGAPNEAILGVPVTPEYFGIALVGGTNPIAALKESGRWVETQALKGVMEINNLDIIDDY